MTTRPEARSSVDGREYRRTAFGLALSIDSRISLPGLGTSPRPAVTDPPSLVLLNPKELDRRWGAVTTEPQRARELRFGDEILLTVDFAEPAGYLMWARDFGRILIAPDGV